MTNKRLSMAANENSYAHRFCTHSALLAELCNLKSFMQSQDCGNVLCNLNQDWHAISGFREHMQCSLEIVQIPRTARNMYMNM